MKKKIILYLSMVLIPLSRVQAALISDQDRPTDTLGGDLRANVVTYINYFLGFLGLLAVAFIIYAGVLLLTAAGDEQKITNGKKIITYAIVGIIVVVFSWTIVNWIVAAGGPSA